MKRLLAAPILVTVLLIASCGSGSHNVSSPTSGAASPTPTPTSTPAPIQLTTSSLPGATVSSAYSATLTASGGTAPYTWSIASGTLPNGLALSSAGVISGTPTAAGSSSFTIQAKDSEATPQAATSALSLTVAAAPVAQAPTTPAYYISTSGNDANPGTLAAPFATFAKAQSAMQASSTIKTTYVRAGNYTLPVIADCGWSTSSCGLNLGSADNGETWSYYPPDGYDSASISGGSTGAGSGDYFAFFFNVTNNLTINGLSIHNFQFAGIGGYNGGSNMVVENNLIFNGYDTADNSAGGFMCYGCANATISHNVVHDIAQMGILLVEVNGDISNLNVTGNVLYNLCTGIADCGALYVQDPSSSGPTNIKWTNNYIRDGNTSATVGWGAALYMDDCASNVTATGNVITGKNGGNTIMIHGGFNNIITGNLTDLSTYGNNVAALQTSSCSNNAMSGNEYEHNIVIGAGGGGGYRIDAGSPPNAPAIANNDYYNYGGSAISSGGAYSDASPSSVNPQLSGWSYTIASGSPVLNSPVNFPALVGGWGPPGYTIPQTGSAPSCTH